MTRHIRMSFSRISGMLSTFYVTAASWKSIRMWSLISLQCHIPTARSSSWSSTLHPPHLDNSNDGAYMAQKYGTLRRFKWQDDIKQGFDECMRVLDINGVLIFKWNETRIPVSRILEIIGVRPLFGHKSGKASRTHWMCFMKMQ